ncbi:MAG: hydrogenase maturation nickel metallochaperone HypA [Dehalococcoidia bacterium]|nr:hydrogenase maturation nickel metallochaperone HypA [Dehalococcoidia bacterium]
MHELSISQAIADLVLKEAKKQRATRIIRVEIEIGELSHLNPEQVDFCVKLAFENTIAAEAALEIQVTKPEIECLKCGYEGPLKPRAREKDPLRGLQMLAFECPECGSTELSVKRGRECTVKRIEVLV